ncbi:alpha/beta fold hydrolase [Marilutibacter maris]|uniref:AB hydrolase-1 domain-containing protein n=1 Tax=Marilutibacter maris TaxID=1605891 RepID=A0A2U9T4C7_9GAMM|nr:alpha/beta hydrolase [Lysobacter maris]AWV07363.1 hypothetical protein C9I47_1667 [Lysobacter maris]
MLELPNTSVIDGNAIRWGRSGDGPPLMDQTFTDEIQDRYRRLDCPVTVLWGEQDGWLPHRMGETLAGLISDSPCIKIPDAGHLVQEDCQEAIMAAVLKRIGGNG